jgi:hypothetical protein
MTAFSKQNAVPAQSLSAPTSLGPGLPSRDEVWRLYSEQWGKTVIAAAEHKLQPLAPGIGAYFRGLIEKHAWQERQHALSGEKYQAIRINDPALAEWLRDETTPRSYYQFLELVQSRDGTRLNVDYESNGTDTMFPIAFSPFLS